MRSNIKTKQTAVCGLLAVLFALAFTACDNSGAGQQFVDTRFWRFGSNTDSLFFSFQDKKQVSACFFIFPLLRVG